MKPSNVFQRLNVTTFVIIASAFAIAPNALGQMPGDVYPLNSTVSSGLAQTLVFSAQYPFDSDNGNSYPTEGSPELDVSIGTSGCSFSLQWTAGNSTPDFSVTDSTNCQVSFTQASYSGGSLSLLVAVTFSSSVRGQSFPYYLQATDNLGGTSSGWWQDPGASISILPPPPVSQGPPQLGTLSPPNGVGTPSQSVTLSFTAFDPNDWGYNNEVELLISPNHTATNACLIAFNSVWPYSQYLFSDDLSTWYSLYGHLSISNSQCTLWAFGTSVSANNGSFATSTTVTASYQLQFSASLVGTNYVDEYISDPTWGTSAGWGQIGTFTVTSNPIISTQCMDLPVGVVGTPYNTSLQVQGSSPPFTWSVVSGALPPGLVLSSNATMYTASLTYAPTQTGTFGFSIGVRDAAGRTAATPLSCSISVINPSDMTTPTGPTTLDPYMPATQVGVFRSRTFMEDSNGNGYGPLPLDPNDKTLSFIPTGGVLATDIPVAGDWNGDGQSKAGIYRPTTGQWFLDANNNGIYDAGDLTYNFGGIGGDIPVVGDWNWVQGISTHRDCVGIFRAGFFWILDLNCNGSFDPGADADFPFGGLSGDVPVVGKWTGGKTRVGVVRKYAPGGVPQGEPFFWLTDNGDANAGSAPANHQPGFAFGFGGLPGDVYVTGDWYKTGVSGAGVYRGGFWVMDAALPRHPQASHVPGLTFGYGGLPSDVPITGKWTPMTSSDPAGAPLSLSLSTPTTPPANSATFTALWSAPGGDASAITEVQIGFQTPPYSDYETTLNDCAIQYYPYTNTLLLGDGLAPQSFPYESPIGLASGQTLSNGICRVDAAHTSFVAVGDVATLIVPVTFINLQNATYSVFTSANIGLVFNNWINLGGWSTTNTQSVLSPPTYQPPPDPAPVPAPPPDVSATVTDCNDISGKWTDAGNDVYTFNQSGSTVTGTILQPDPYCAGGITWTVSGTSVGPGTFSLTDVGPSTDACGNTINFPTLTATAQISCSSATITPSGSTTSSSLVLVPLAGYTAWTRIATTAPGITLTARLMENAVFAYLVGAKTDKLTITISQSGQGASSTTLGTIDPATGATAPGNPFKAAMTRTSLPLGQYGRVTANWGNTSVSVPVSFYNVGYTRFSQYNTPYEPSCNNNPQPAWIIYKIDNEYCYYQKVSLGSTFIFRVGNTDGGTGTGTLGTGQVLKSYAAGAKNVCYLPDGGLSTNTFFAVDVGGSPITKVTGGLHAQGKPNTVLSDGTGTPSTFNNNNPQLGSVATDPNVTNPAANPIFQPGDQILLVDPDARDSDSPQLRSVQDYCPACYKGYGPPSYDPNSVAHIDMYSSNPSCSGVTDYGYRFVFRLR